MHLLRRSAAVVASLFLVGAVAAGCSSSGSSSSSKSSSTTAGSGATLTVPAQYKTIQKAVDAAKPGDLVLVSPGVYHEAVNVGTDNVVIRGTDRNKVILEGDFKLQNGIRVLGSKGVAVENMTARDYTSNGFYWTGVDGYRGSYLTAYNNGDYGIYSYDSVNGTFDHSYGSGQPDAGFYIGGCNPCTAVISDVTSEYNGLGYSGTNSGGGLYIVNSTFRHNRAGIVPNTGSYEPCYPERGDTIAGNLVYDNNYTKGPAIDSARLAQNNGIVVAGGWDNQILRNRVDNHDLGGIVLVPFPEDNPTDVEPTKPAATCAEQNKQAKPPKDKVPATVLWNAHNNTVKGNVVSNSGLADLGAFDSDGSHHNCFADNTFKTSAPDDIEQVEPCEGKSNGAYDKNPLDVIQLISRKTAPSGNYKTQPTPPPQAQMPHAKTAAAKPAGPPAKVDVAAIEVPALPGK